MREPRQRRHDGHLVWNQHPTVADTHGSPVQPSPPDEKLLFLALHFLQRLDFTLCCNPTAAYGHKKKELLCQLCRVYRYANQEQAQKLAKGVRQTAEHMEATSKYRENNRWKWLMWSNFNVFRFQGEDKNTANKPAVKFAYFVHEFLWEAMSETAVREPQSKTCIICM